MSFNVMKPKFDPQITWGHILTALTVSVPLVVWGARLDTKTDITREELARQQRIVENLSVATAENAKANAILTQRFADHVDKQK